ncbi:hypothetical protein BFJ63_vAg16877 [Fusarium oxysporum f. sp. narcissi]|uniref:Uncharacterized protein n=1 Tax=Fusarium oxysporum f. sp. narcissi TaxID=451672 RepID=A0A4Q2V126_FUSOX|nr:hypothetical protein BFJ63_vAg16877 [Fusarium oxysporum f. sp. narcissi]
MPKYGEPRSAAAVDSIAKLGTSRLVYSSFHIFLSLVE